MVFLVNIFLAICILGEPLETIKQPLAAKLLPMVGKYNIYSERHLKEVIMSKEELRRAKRGNSTAAGNVQMEVEQIKKIQMGDVDSKRSTITVGCSEFMTLICCP